MRLCDRVLQIGLGVLLFVGFVVDSRAGITNPTPGQSFPPETAVVDFAWDPVADAVSYDLRLLLNDAVHHEATGIVGTAWSLATTFPPGYYSAFVRGVTAGGPGAWSAPVTFTVQRRMIPAGNPVLSRAPTVFRWSRNPGATRYRAKLFARDPDTGLFAATHADWIAQPDSGLPRWSLPASAMPGGKYKWSVTDYRGTNPGYTSTAFFQVKRPTGMALIPGGDFRMGDSFLEGELRERPVHKVYVSPFFIDRREVTYALWIRVRDWSWSGGRGYSYSRAGMGRASRHPVYLIPWYDAIKWCNARSQMEGRKPVYYTDAALKKVYKTGLIDPYTDWSATGYRLPTEAEWEKAARGGAKGRRFPWRDSDAIKHARANYYSSAYFSYDLSPTHGFHPVFHYGPTVPFTSPAGYFAPNGYGLYDMAGNLGEWCWDIWSDVYYASSPDRDPRGPETEITPYRAMRGGGYGDDANICRAASRDYRLPSMAGYITFRTVLNAGP